MTWRATFARPYKKGKKEKNRMTCEQEAAAAEEALNDKDKDISALVEQLSELNASRQLLVGRCRLTSC